MNEILEKIVAEGLGLTYCIMHGKDQDNLIEQTPCMN